MYKGQKTFEMWVSRAAGAAVVATFLLMLIPFFDDRTLSAFATAIGAGLGAGLIVLMVGNLIGIVVLASLDGASSYKNPFSQGVAFAGFLVLLIAIIDLLLLRGDFVVQPALTLFFSGEFGDSFWGCRDHWVFADEGSFCDR